MWLTDAQVKARQLKKQQARAEDARHQREVPTAAPRAASDSVERQELQLEAQGGSAVAAAALERLGISALPVRQTVVAATVRLAPQLTVPQVVPQQPPTARNIQAEAAPPKHLLAGGYPNSSCPGS